METEPERRWRRVLAAGLLLAAGCGGPQPVTGGTRGLLHAANMTVADIEVAVYGDDSQEVVGTGVSGGDGWFELRNAAASSAVRLPAGRYAITLRAIGPDPVRIPSEYSSPQTTPLKIDWVNESDVLDLELPEPR